MSEMTFEDAAQALSDASAAPEPGQAPDTPAPEAASQQPPSQEVDTGATPEGDSFTNIDPNSLPEELKALYRNMQADYTRKTQEVAPFRQLAEQGVDVNRAVQALQFVEALETDPQFVQTVHQQLTQALEASGYTPAQAQAAATEALGGDGEEEFVDPVAQRVEQLESQLQQMQQMEMERALAAELERSELAIRQAHPDWKDEDMNAVFEMAFAYGGDLNAAAQSYAALRDRLVSSYIDGKAAAAGAAPPVVEGGGHAESPTQGFGDDIDAAHKAATAHLLNLLGQNQ